MAYTTIKKPSDYFNTKLYTGTGASNSITGVNFQPDLVWIKSRSVIRDHVLTDSVRGIASQIHSNTTDAESTYTNDVTSFDSDGFTVSTDSDVNGDTFTYASWNWLGANASSSNTDGSITSNVSANTTSGFSIVSWTGDGTSTATIGHSLGVTPSMIILKNRTDVTNWVVKHKSLSSGYNLFLNDSSAVYNTTGQGHLADLSSSSTFGFVAGSSGNNQSNGSGDGMIAYCFAEKKGFSKFGSYVGNGSTDGTFVYTGFKPAWVIIKNTSSTGTWIMKDNKRDPFNVANTALGANLSAPGSDYDPNYNEIDILSNGFKLRDAYSDQNTSGSTYIYMAFAEEPLVGDNPATAR